MRKNIFIALLSCLLFSLICPAMALADGADVQNIPIYRVCNDQSLEHLFTTDRSEVDSLVQNHGWRDEGIGWYAPRTGDPVFRLNNQQLGNHLYTTDQHEVSELCANHGWNLDNNGNPLFYSGGSIPIYRLYNHGLNGMHLLTTDQTEYNSLPAGGWAQEGVALYAAGASSHEEAPQGNATIENTPAEYAIEADVNLNGSGSGCHAKILACTSTSAVSFGPQYDQHAEAPYTDTTAYLIENVDNNNAGGQKYTRTGYAQKGQTSRLMLAVQKDGTCDVYVNGAKVGSVHNSNLAGKQLYLRVEGSARVNGDSVNAQFSNIKLKHGDYNASKTWNTHNFDTSPTIHSSDNYRSNKSISISGTVSGLGANQDWDSAYNKVSGIIQFVE